MVWFVIHKDGVTSYLKGDALEPWLSTIEIRDVTVSLPQSASAV